MYSCDGNAEFSAVIISPVQKIIINDKLNRLKVTAQTFIV